jgi:integrase
MVIGHVPMMSLADARERAYELRRTLDRGIDPRRARSLGRRGPVDIARGKGSPQAERHSVDHLVDEFTQRYLRPHRKRPKYAEDILARDVLPEWGNRDARTIEPGEVIDLLDRIVDRGSPVAANRTASLLTQLFKFGVHRRLVPISPVQLLFAPGGKEKRRKRTLSDSELKVFLRDPKGATRFERLSRVITLLLLTGQRRGELTQSRWSDIDFKTKLWTNREESSKTDQVNLVPLSDWTIEEFEALRLESEGSPWVLPGTDKSQHIDPKLLTRGMAKCQRRLKERGIEKFTLHDLRRTCRTGLGRLKVPPHIAERVVNHAQEPNVETYDQYDYLDEKRSALESWATHLRKLREEALSVK